MNGAPIPDIRDRLSIHYHLKSINTNINHINNNNNKNNTNNTNKLTCINCIKTDDNARAIATPATHDKIQTFNSKHNHYHKDVITQHPTTTTIVNSVNATSIKSSSSTTVTTPPRHHIISSNSNHHSKNVDITSRVRTTLLPAMAAVTATIPTTASNTTTTTPSPSASSPTSPTMVIGGGSSTLLPISVIIDNQNFSTNFLNISIVTSGTSSSNSMPAEDVDNGDDINSFHFYKTEQLTVLCILFIIIVVGNLAVLITLTMNKSRKSRMNFFIKHLAIADLAVGLINVFTDIVWRITITWHAGNAACKLIRFLQAVVTYASTYVLVALSIDRYDAITHPMNFSGSWRRARILVSIAWLLSALFSLPTIFLFEEKPIEGQMQCWIDLEPWQWKVYMTLISVALFVLPALIISACYTIIVRTIWSKSKLMLVPPATVGIVQSHTAAVNGTDERILRHRHLRDDLHDCRRASSRGIIPKAKIKTVKMTFVIVFVFVLCWSPYIVFDLLQVYGYIPRTQTNIAIATFVQSLAPLNSAANPVIYCLFSTQMCRSLKNLPPFKWFICCLTICMDVSRSVNAHCLGCNNDEDVRPDENDSEDPRRYRHRVRYRMRRQTSGTRTTSSRDSTRTASSLIALSSSVTRRSSSVTSLRQHAVRLHTIGTNQIPLVPPGGSTISLPTIQQQPYNRQKFALSNL